MKLRHAAALALVGWYLMIPPSVDTNVPIVRWNHVGSYDAATECESARVKLVETNKGNEHRQNLVLQSECIATDDPRLKEK